MKNRASIEHSIEIKSSHLSPQLEEELVKRCTGFKESTLYGTIIFLCDDPQHLIDILDKKNIAYKINLPESKV